METFPLTTVGVAAWQAKLYQSAVSVIEQEAADAATNFKDWLSGRFDLRADQMTYLSDIDDNLTQHWGSNVAFFIRRRLPIEFIKPEETPAVRSSKLVLSEEELRELEEGARVSAERTFEGVLRFRITY